MATSFVQLLVVPFRVVITLPPKPKQVSRLPDEVEVGTQLWATTGWTDIEAATVKAMEKPNTAARRRAVEKRRRGFVARLGFLLFMSSSFRFLMNRSWQ